MVPFTGWWGNESTRRSITRISLPTLEFRQELKEHLDRNSREKLLKLVNLGIELREETSLAAFIAGFQLALGIASKLTPYSFDNEEEQRAYEASRQRRGE